MAYISERTPLPGDTGRGIIAILMAEALLSLSNALVKLSGDRFGLAQLVLLRSLFAALLLAAWVLAFEGRSGFRLARPGWVWLRSLCLAAMWLSYYAALPSMSFALAAACYYTSPALMALLARFLLGTEIGRRGWTAVVLSLGGAFLAIAPEPGTFTPTLLLPLAAAALYALAGIITWRHCQTETPGAMAFTLNTCICLMAGAGLVVLVAVRPDGDPGFVLSVWPRLEAKDWSLAFALGGLLAIIATAVAMAYSLAPTPLVGVFDTAYLGFAAMWGAVLFCEMPSPGQAFGITMIAAGAILMSVGRRSRVEAR